MRTKLKSILLCLVIGLGLVGCVGSTSNGPNKESSKIKIISPEKKDIFLTANNNPYVLNGAIVKTNGDKIYDEDGDIIEVLMFENKLYYIVNLIGKKKYLIKDSNEKILKSLDAENVFVVKDNKYSYLITKLKGNKSKIYDNVYKFEGEKIKLINKNVNVKGHLSGNYIVKTPFKRMRSGGYIMKNQYNLDIRNGSTVNVFNKIKTSYKPNMLPMVIGSRGDYIYYVYTSGFLLGTESLIEAYNVKTKKTYTLAKDNDKIQFLTLGNDVVLKIFKNDVKSESKIHGHYTNMISKYKDEPATYIYLNTLKEINGVSDDFKPFHLHSGFDNLGGGYTRQTLITFPVFTLKSYFFNKIDYANGAPIF